MRKLVTILFTIWLIFTTQTVYAEDRAQSSGGLTIPVEFIAIPTIIILLIAFGLLAKHYSRFRDQLGDDHYIEPAPTSKATTIAPIVVREPVHSNDTENKPKEQDQTSKKSAEKSHIEVRQAETPAQPKDEQLPKEYKILHIFAYILIVAGIILRLFAGRKNK